MVLAWVLAQSAWEWWRRTCENNGLETYSIVLEHGAVGILRWRTFMWSHL